MKEFLVRTDDQKIATKAVEDGFTTIVSNQALKGLGKVRLLQLLPDGGLHENTKRRGEWVRLASKKDELGVAALRGKRDLVVVDATDWRVIPLENLIAALEGKTKLYALAKDPKEAELFLTTLETGVDGVVVQPKTIKDLAGFKQLMARQTQRTRSLVAATVTSIEPVGMGERVCIDTANILNEGEGMLIGSSSLGFFLVAAETKETPFVRARPFRVNAGAVHSYILSGAKTNYLSELESGQTIEAVDRTGNARDVVIGRCKIETRPMLQLQAEAEGKTYRVILQNAETIRLATPRGAARPVSEIKPGQKVLMHLETAARHFGMAVKERIEEK